MIDQYAKKEKYRAQILKYSTIITLIKSLMFVYIQKKFPVRYFRIIEICKHSNYVTILNLVSLIITLSQYSITLTYITVIDISFTTISCIFAFTTPIELPVSMRMMFGVILIIDFISFIALTKINSHLRIIEDYLNFKSYGASYDNHEYRENLELCKALAQTIWMSVFARILVISFNKGNNVSYIVWIMECGISILILLMQKSRNIYIYLYVFPLISLYTLLACFCAYIGVMRSPTGHIYMISHNLGIVTRYVIVMIVVRKVCKTYR